MEVKFLHTADWHVGKVLKGRQRAGEQHAVLTELVELARAEDVDATIVAGDLFDTAAPSPESQALVMHTLLALRESRREVVVLAGNHDDPRLLDAYRPVLGQLGIHVLGAFRGPDDGGLLSFTARSGEPVQVAALPFLSHRYVVRAAEALAGSPDEHTRAYADRIDSLLGALTAGFRSDTVNLAATHGTLPEGKLGGGEREAQSVASYYFAPSAFPASTQYAALGHLHRRQQVPGPCPIWYCGSPIAVDFGDEEESPGALVVTAEPGRPATVREHRMASARRLRTVHGTLEQLASMNGELGDAWLRVVVAERPHAGLAAKVREVLPNAIDVDIDERYRPAAAGRRHGVPDPARARRPGELFREFMRAAGREDSGDSDGGAVAGLFDRLHDEVTSGAHARARGALSGAAGEQEGAR